MSRKVALLLVLLALPCLVQGQSDDSFTRIATSDGLSQGYVSAIHQDKFGFIWVGTKEGLNRYDGYQFTTFLHDPKQAASLPGNFITTLAGDKRGNVWIGTRSHGLGLYNSEQETLQPFLHQPNDSNSLVNKEVSALHVDGTGKLWVATIGYGLWVLEFDSASDETTLSSVQKIRLEQDSIPMYNYVHAFYEDDAGRMWVGTSASLYSMPVVHPGQSVIQHAEIVIDPETGPISGVMSFCRMENGQLWLGRWGGIQKFDLPSTTFLPERIDFEGAGKINDIISSRNYLWVWDRTRKRIGRCKKDSTVEHSKFNPFLAGGSILCLFQDRSNIMWMGAAGNGLLKFNPMFDYFHPRQDVTLPGFNELTTKIAKDGKGNIWINGALLDPNTGQRMEPDTPLDLLKETWSLGADGNFWAVSRELVCIDVNNKRQSFYPYLPNSLNMAGGLLSLSDSTLWGGGSHHLYRFNISDKSFTYYPYPDPIRDAIHAPRFTQWLRDKNGTIWGAGRSGLIQFNPATGQMELHANSAVNGFQLPVTQVYSILEDPADRGIIWLGTKSSGLLRLEIGTGKFKEYTTNNGLSDNTVYGILGDQKGMLWLSTNRGLNKFDPQTEAIRVYRASDGLQKGEFNQSAFIKDNNGRLYFGGMEGLNAFYPESIPEDDTIGQIVITGFKLDNLEANYKKEGSPLASSITQTQHFELNHKQNMVTFEFAAMDFTDPASNKFTYKLDGLNESWIDNGHAREATFTNLDPGHYVFRVRASKLRGEVGNLEAQVAFFIHPPWWATWWARTMAVLIALAMAYLVFRVRLNNLRLKDQAVFDRNEANRVAKLNQAKSDFFSNITHELRTPLTLIMGPLEKLMETEKTASEQEWLQMVKKHSIQLQRLIDQQLDFARLEGGAMTLNLSWGDLVGALNTHFNAFQEMGKQKELEMKFKTNVPTLTGSFDKKKMEMLTYNLLSNACKFTLKGGKIKVSLEQIPQQDSGIGPCVKIMVADNGRGIPADQLPFVFDRFYRVERTDTERVPGSGIGLTLCKELVEMQGGTIEVSSEVNKGTTFTMVFTWPECGEGAQTLETSLTTDTEPAGQNSMKGQASGAVILIIEDNADIRQFIRKGLTGIGGDNGTRYVFMEADNGTTGIELGIKHIPDLVISDIMMPGKDGFAVCAQLKQEAKTSHIPVILLTAKSTLDSKIKGLHTGADDYLTKPFSLQELSLRIENLLRQQQKLQDHYRKEFLLKPEQIEAKSMEEEFLLKVKQVLKDNLSNDEFSVETFSKLMHMDRSQLHRKLKALTNHSASRLVRTYRLEHARQLLKSRVASVSEIAFSCGFSDRTYFTRCFVEEFGFPPSEAAQKE